LHLAQAFASSSREFGNQTCPQRSHLFAVTLTFTDTILHNENKLRKALLLVLTSYVLSVRLKSSSERRGKTMKRFIANYKAIRNDSPKMSIANTLKQAFLALIDNREYGTTARRNFGISENKR
jgi:hypothetical protein